MSKLDLKSLVVILIIAFIYKKEKKKHFNHHKRIFILINFIFFMYFSHGNRTVWGEKINIRKHTTQCVSWFWYNVLMWQNMLLLWYNFKTVKFLCPAKAFFYILSLYFLISFQTEGKSITEIVIIYICKLAEDRKYIDKKMWNFKLVQINKIVYH